MKKMCNLPFDSALDSLIDVKEGSMYNAYLGSIETSLKKSPPNWQAYMSDVDDQGNNTNCAVFAACATAEGQLQIMYGSRIGSSGIDLEEWSSSNPIPISTALRHIRSSKISSEVDPVVEYPNFEGIKWTIESYSSRVPGYPNIPIDGITNLKLALEHDPVAAELKL